MNIATKLAIGTAQFGLNYGISNRSGKVKKEEVYKILNFARKNGIDTLDTAREYGDSEKILGEYEHISDFKIVSKFKKVEDIEEYISITLKNLNLESIYAYLSHDFEDFKKNIDFISHFYEIKEKGLVRKIGFSLYYPEELEFLIEKDIKFDLVQIPYNLFDRRFERYFSILKQRNVEIHIRSVFLQGLFFLDIDKLPEFFKRVEDKLKIIRETSKIYNISIKDMALSFCVKNKYIDKIVIGVDSLQQLKENINIKFLDNSEIYSFLEENDENIIIPMNWRY